MALTYYLQFSNENILKAIHSMGYQKPSKIQSKALPLMLMDPPRNMIAQSQSGTGKTAAFVITILSRLDYTKPQSPQAICLAPSRELARQIEGVFRVIGQFIPGLTIQAAVPGAVSKTFFLVNFCRVSILIQAMLIYTSRLREELRSRQ